MTSCGITSSLFTVVAASLAMRMSKQGDRVEFHGTALIHQKVSRNDSASSLVIKGFDHRAPLFIQPPPRAVDQVSATIPWQSDSQW